MKKTLIIALIILVLAIIGVFAFFEFRISEITFVDDYVFDDEETNKFSVKRLYSSDIDVEELNERIEKLILLEFTEEEILRAALDAGTPEFYPSFNIDVVKREKDGVIVLSLSALQELAEGQEKVNFSLDKTNLEIVTTGFTMDEINAYTVDFDGEHLKSVGVLKNEAENGATFNLGEQGKADIELAGESGTIVIQYVYDIKTNTLFPETKYTDCFAAITVNVSTDENGELFVTYSKSEASTVDEYIEQ